MQSDKQSNLYGVYKDKFLFQMEILRCKADMVLKWAPFLNKLYLQN